MIKRYALASLALWSVFLSGSAWAEPGRGSFRGPAPERSGHFAMRSSGLVGASADAAINLNGAMLPHARDGDVFANFTVRDFGTANDYGLIRIVAPTSAISIHDVVADNGYRFLDVSTSGSTLRDSTVERVRVTGLIRSFARIRADSHDLVFRDIDVTFRSNASEPPALPGGIQIGDTAHDILLERVTVRGARMVEIPGKYTNGDGFSTEKDNHRITFRHVEADDNSDGGFDLKSKETRLEDTVSSGNGRNYRFWGTGEATTITSRDPRKAHIWLGPNADWHIAHLVIRSTNKAPVIDISAPAHLRIDSYDIQVPPNTPLVADETGAGQSMIDWGPQGPPRI